MATQQEELQTVISMLDLGWSCEDIGRHFVEHGGAVESQSAQRCEVAYIRTQREMVARTGACEGRCNESELMTLPRGDVVCRRTREPCVRLQAAAELEMWSVINKE